MLPDGTGADAAAEHAPPPAVNANASVTEQEAAVLDELDAEVAREMEAPRPRHERLAVLVDIEEHLKRRMSGGA